MRHVQRPAKPQPVAYWNHLLSVAAGAFTAPTFVLFQKLVWAWIMYPGRHTVTHLIDPEDGHAHDAYHRLLRAGVWTLESLWRVVLLQSVVTLLPHGGIVRLALDDTLFHKTGPKVNGAGIFRDAVRSTMNKVVYARGLNAVVLALLVQPPWGGEPLALPISYRLHRKDAARTYVELAEDMLREVARWLPEKYRFKLVCDGAYSSLAGVDLPRCHVTSRMRRDAALYEPAPAREPGRRGRPRKKGERLPTPQQMAAHASQQDWKLTRVSLRGKLVQRLLLCRTVLWYENCPWRLLQLVIVRDPQGKEQDDFFFTTDLAAKPEDVVSEYAERWAIEDTFRNTKQFLRGEDPQCWKHHGPERVVGLSFWIYSLVWLWYLQVWGDKPSWTSMPWYPNKRTPSFKDALAVLRTALWQHRILAKSGQRPHMPKIVELLIRALARAA